MHADAHSDVYEMPVCRVAIVGTVLAHRGHPGSIFEGETSDRYGLKELGQGPILGEIRLEKEEGRDRVL